MSSNDNDFYIVLPSNACPNIHPDNKASKFLVSWQSALDLQDGKWQVALTELIFNYSPRSINTRFGIEVERYIKDSITVEDCLIILNTKPPALGVPLHLPKPKSPYQFDWTAPVMTVNGEGKLVFTSEYRFTMDFRNLEDAHAAGFTSKEVDCTIEDSSYVIRAQNKPNEQETKKKKKKELEHATVTFRLFSLSFPIIKAIFFDDDYSTQWTNVMEMVKYAREKFQDVFSYFDVNESGKIAFRIQPELTRISLLGGFNFVLGFEQVNFKVIEFTTHTATYYPQLYRGIQQIYIYASCCAPIRVGDVEVPLLRTVAIEDDVRDHNTIGVTKNMMIKNPMYLPVCNTTINTVEINIRDDAGKLVPFVEGSKTILTLHFRKTT